MTQIIHNSTQKARKQYDDDAYWLICEFVDDISHLGLRKKFSFAELRLMVTIKQRRPEARYIMPGDSYVRQRNKMDGDIFTFKAKEAFHDFCCKYDLYPED